ncbi:MAG: hypothetical protein MJ252_09500 [archaeon]|nr:hypothetical protein [archaeon]
MKYTISKNSNLIGYGEYKPYTETKWLGVLTFNEVDLRNIKDLDDVELKENIRIHMKTEVAKMNNINLTAFSPNNKRHSAKIKETNKNKTNKKKNDKNTHLHHNYASNESLHSKEKEKTLLLAKHSSSEVEIRNNTNKFNKKSMIENESILEEEEFREENLGSTRGKFNKEEIEFKSEESNSIKNFDSVSNVNSNFMSENLSLKILDSNISKDNLTTAKKPNTVTENASVLSQEDYSKVNSILTEGNLSHNSNCNSLRNMHKDNTSHNSIIKTRTAYNVNKIAGKFSAKPKFKVKKTVADAANFKRKKELNEENKNKKTNKNSNNKVNKEICQTETNVHSINNSKSPRTKVNNTQNNFYPSTNNHLSQTSEKKPYRGVIKNNSFSARNASFKSGTKLLNIEKLSLNSENKLYQSSLKLPLNESLKNLEECIIDKSYQNKITNDENILLNPLKAANQKTLETIKSESEPVNFCDVENAMSMAGFEDINLYNFSTLNNLKTDFNIFYTEEYLRDIPDDMLTLELQLLIEKVLDIQLAYTGKLKALLSNYIKNRQRFKYYSEQYIQLKKMENKLQIEKAKKTLKERRKDHLLGRNLSQCTTLDLKNKKLIESMLSSADFPVLTPEILENMERVAKGEKERSDSEIKRHNDKKKIKQEKLNNVFINVIIKHKDYINKKYDDRIRKDYIISFLNKYKEEVENIKERTSEEKKNKFEESKTKGSMNTVASTNASGGNKNSGNNPIFVGRNVNSPNFNKMVNNKTVKSLHGGNSKSMVGTEKQIKSSNNKNKTGGNRRLSPKENSNYKSGLYASNTVGNILYTSPTVPNTAQLTPRRKVNNFRRKIQNQINKV